MKEEDLNIEAVNEIRKLKVLIIEDDEFITMVYQDHLENTDKVDFSFDAFTELGRGLEALESGDYDVLLLDLNLPDSDYSHTISKIPDLAFNIPIIIMTSTNDEELALRTMNMGGQDYLVKDRLDGTLFIRSILYATERHQLKVQLKEEKEKSDSLLHNILPNEVIREIKEKGYAEAQEIDQASILFTDFSGFTSISEKLSAKSLVEEIDACFKEFDQILDNYQVEKIKTIGDAYMAAGGVPVANTNSAKHTVLAALKMQDFMKTRAELRKANNLPYFEMRAGIHTGHVVAGIVGLKKFQFDIWGDTVNIASRMESHGEITRVNISKTTYDLIQNDPDFYFESRGVLDVKGKGPMEMFFVSRKQSH